MEIKNGLVQWNGRNDIPCTYAEMEDGTKYYFKQDFNYINFFVWKYINVPKPFIKIKDIFKSF